MLGVRIIGQGADGCFQAALASFVFFSPERQTSATRIAIAFAVILVPYSVIGPFAGVLLDRWSRQRVLSFANLLRSGLALVVAGFVWLGHDNVWFLAAALAAIGVNRFILAGLSAALPHVVPPSRLVTANAVSTTVGTLATVAGIGVGVLLRLATGGDDAGLAPVVVVAALGYAGAALVAATTIQRWQLGPDVAIQMGVRAALASVGRGALHGLQHLGAIPPVRAAIGALGLYRLGWAMVTVHGILLIRQTYNDPADPDAGLASLGTAFLLGGLGVFMAALVTPALARRFGTVAVVTAALLVAAGTEVTLGPRFTETTLFVSAFFVTAAGQSLKICVDTEVQTGIEDVYRGRVFSVYDLVFNVSFVLGGLLAALVLPPDGRSLTVIWVAAACWCIGAAWHSLAAHRASPPSLSGGVPGP